MQDRSSVEQGELKDSCFCRGARYGFFLGAIFPSCLYRGSTSSDVYIIEYI